MIETLGTKIDKKIKELREEFHREILQLKNLMKNQTVIQDDEEDIEENNLTQMNLIVMTKKL